MSEWDGNTERRVTTLELLTKMQVKLDSLLENQNLIKVQVIKTNGRVSSLENWKAFILGGLAILTIILVPMFIVWFEAQLK